MIPCVTRPPSHARLGTIHEPKLRRELGLRDLVLFNIAAVIGIRWLAPPRIRARSPLPLAPRRRLLLHSLGTGRATLSSKFPDEGGIYVWTKQGFGDWHGFLVRLVLLAEQSFYLPNLLLAGVDMAGYALGSRKSKFMSSPPHCDTVDRTANQYLRTLRRQVDE